MPAPSPGWTPLYWIEGPWPGRLAIASCPFGGTWLADNLQAWRQEGVDVVVSLLEGIESASLDLADEDRMCQRLGLIYPPFPIRDHGVPSSQEVFRGFVGELQQMLAAGQSVAMHCLAGIGRSGLTASCVLIGAGLSPELAVRRVSMARGLMVPETLEQKEWIGEFARLNPASV